jgi:group I intron endonuclease
MQEVRQECLVYIYRLLDPLRENAVRYIGQSQDPERRLYEHLVRARCGDRNHRSTWLRKVLAAGLQPILEIVEEATVDTWAERERYWIAHYRALGCPLVNHTDGGEGVLGLRHSDDVRRKISEARRGRGQWPEERKREFSERFGGSGNPWFGHQYTDEEKARISAALTGRPSPKKGKSQPADPWVVYITLDPEGVQHIVTNLREFCEERGLTRSGMLSTASGRCKNHKGWRCRRAGDPPFKPLDKPLQVKKPRDAEFVLTRPDETTVKVRSLVDFCRENGLHESNFYAILRGTKKTYKGWRIRRPEDNQ